MERIVIIGGNAAGMTAASRARRLNANLHLTVVESGPYAAYSICGAPYLVSGVVGNAEDLVPFTPQEFFRQRGVEVRVQTEALSIHPGLKRIDLRCRKTGRRETLAYDRLLLATGYLPLMPRLSGIDHPRVFTLSRLESAAALHALAKEGRLRHVLLLGGGYISLQLCEALLPFSCRMTLVEAGDDILGYLDRDMSEIVAHELKIQGLQVLFGATLSELRQARDGPGVSALIQPGGYWNTCDAILIDIGMMPNVDLGVRAGVRLGRSGAIEVTDRMETSVFGIYAAGNCAEAMHLVAGRPQANFLATVAQKQGRAAGENLAGQIGRFHGHVGTSILKVFGLSIGSTGLSTREALRCGFRADAVKISAPVSAEYLPDSVHLTLKVVFDRENGRLLGAQAIGTRGVAGRIDVLASCLQRRQTIDEVAQLDLAYAPSLSQVWDPIHVAMHAAQRVIRQSGR